MNSMAPIPVTCSASTQRLRPVMHMLSQLSTGTCSASPRNGQKGQSDCYWPRLPHCQLAFIMYTRSGVGGRPFQAALGMGSGADLVVGVVGGATLIKAIITFKVYTSRTFSTRDCA